MKECIIKSLNPGDRFVYGMKSAVVLEKMNDGVLCMVVDEDYQCEFDKNNSNNFSKSMLRKRLNDSYLHQWFDKGAYHDDFVAMTVDLTADDGLDDYGTCKCYLAPRTCDQHRKYRKLIPGCEYWEWTATPYSTKSNGYSCNVHGVSTDGSLRSNSASNARWVRPLFKLQSNAEVETDSETKTANSFLTSAVQALVDEYGLAAVKETLEKVFVG